MMNKLAIISLAFFLFSGNFQSYELFSNISVNLTMLSMVLPLAYYLWWTIKYSGIHRSSIILLIFFVAILPNLIYLDNSVDKTIIFLLTFFVLFLISPVLLRDIQSRRIFIISIFLFSFIISLLTLIGFDTSFNETERITLDGGNPIWVARALSMGLIIIIILKLYNSINLKWFLISIFPFIITIIYTGSRGPTVAFLLSLLIVLLHRIKIQLKLKYILYFFIFIILLIPTASVAYLLIPTSFNRLFDFSAESGILTRMNLYSETINVIINSPLGIGLGNFNDFSSFTYPHNLFLEIFVELGWFIGFLFLILVVISLTGLFKQSGESVENKVILGLFLIALINSLFSGDMTSPKELYLLLPIGVNAFYKYNQYIKSKPNDFVR